MKDMSVIVIILFFVLFTWSSINTAIVIWRNPRQLLRWNPFIGENYFDLWVWVYRIIFSLVAIGCIAVWVYMFFFILLN
jgi:hypothetical protein